MSLTSIGLPRRVGLRVIFDAIRTRIFEIFSRPQNFRSEISCKRAQIRDSRRRPASPRGKQVRNVSGEHQYSVAYEIARVFSARFGPKISKIFRGRTIFSPKTRAIAPKSELPDDARPCHDAKRSAMCLASIDLPRRARLRAFFGAIRTENFEKFSRPQNFQSENACDRAEIRVR